METGTLTHTFQQLDTVLFPLILANMFHCYIPKIPNNKVYKYSYNVHCLIDTHLHPISTSLDILGLDILGLDILTIRHSGNDSLCIQTVLLHLSEQFSYLNTPWSQRVRISDYPLYSAFRLQSFPCSCMYMGMRLIAVTG